MNFFSWEDCSSLVTSIGAISSLTGNTSLTGAVSPPYGTGAMRLDVIGNDAGNQQMGADGLPWIEYGDDFVGGRKLFYRCWMRIEPGFSWGAGTAKTKSSRTGAGPIVEGSATNGQGYTSYVAYNGFLMAECDTAGCTVPGGGFNTDTNHVIAYDVAAMDDGEWHEYIFAVKPNTGVAVADAEFEVYVDGALVGSANNYILHPNGPPHTLCEAWAGLMVKPYFQLNGTALDGGTIYVGDFSTDDAFNSRLAGAGGGASGRPHVWSRRNRR